MKQSILKFYIFLILLLTLLTLPAVTKAQTAANDVENDYNTWIEGTLSKKLSKQFRLSVTPEVRLDDQFQLNKFLMEGKLKYAPFKHFDMAVGYRYTLKNRIDKTNKQYNRLAFEMGADTKLNRFHPEFRLKYTTEKLTGSTDDNTNFLRYKGSVDYNISKSKFTPYLSAEAFQWLNESQFYKIRYAIGSEYKINKANSLKIGYSLDYYLLEYKNRHILNLSYTFRL